MKPLNPQRGSAWARGLPPAALALSLAAAGLLAACGGGDNPLGNPPTITNGPSASAAQQLSFAYFQRCVMPVLNAQLSTTVQGATSTQSCASGGCHDNNTGTGGALRLSGTAANVDLAAASFTAEAARATAMYRNFYSAQGETLIGTPLASRLLTKPLVNGVLHGGGLIFASASDANARLIEYWISHPMPAGQDEFSSAAAALFTPADVATGQCKTE